jgi:hypothetical protein
MTSTWLLFLSFIYSDLLIFNNFSALLVHIRKIQRNSMMNKRLLLLILSITALFVSGCSSSPVFKDPHEKNQSLVVAYIDMSDADSEATWMSAKVIVKRGKEPTWYTFGFIRDKKLGVILHNQYVTPGKIKLDAFGGNATGFFDNAIYQYNFPAQGRGMGALNIKKQGIYYAGSFKFIPVETGFFERGKFDIKRTKKPTEKEVLSAFLKQVEDGKWKKMIQARIKRLK